MEITPSISKGNFTDASAQIMRSGLEQMREKNEQLYMRVVQLEASNKRMKEQLKILVSVEGEIAKRAKEALEMEGA
jgi:cell division protein FtsB